MREAICLGACIVLVGCGSGADQMPVGPSSPPSPHASEVRATPHVVASGYVTKRKSEYVQLWVSLKFDKSWAGIEAFPALAVVGRFNDRLPYVLDRNLNRNCFILAVRKKTSQLSESGGIVDGRLTFKHDMDAGLFVTAAMQEKIKAEMPISPLKFSMKKQRTPRKC